MRIEIDRNRLEAALLFASKDATRKVLQGVYLETSTGRVPTLAATDGRRLFCCPATEKAQPFAGESLGILLPTALCRQTLKLADPLLTLSIKVGTLKTIEKATYRSVVMEIQTEMGEARLVIILDCSLRYPAFRHLVVAPDPAPVNTRRHAFNPKLMTDFQKAARLLGCKTEAINLEFSPDGLGIIRILARQDLFYGILMPMKTDSWPTIITTPAYMQ